MDSVAPDARFGRQRMLCDLDTFYSSTSTPLWRLLRIACADAVCDQVACRIMAAMPAVPRVQNDVALRAFVHVVGAQCRYEAMLTAIGEALLRRVERLALSVRPRQLRAVADAVSLAVMDALGSR